MRSLWYIIIDVKRVTFAGIYLGQSETEAAYHFNIWTHLVQNLDSSI